MGKSQPSGGIRNAWFPQGHIDGTPVKRHCGTCNQAFTSPADCRCECHKTNPKETER